MAKSKPSWLMVGRWTELEARAALLALESSGESVVGFARRHGLDAQRLYAWRRRLQGPTAEAESVPTFVEVIAEAAAKQHDGVFEVVLRTGDVVRVPRQFDDQALGRLLSVVRGE